MAKSSWSHRARAASARRPRRPRSPPDWRCKGNKTAVVDFDVGLRNLDLIMGCERRVVFDLINVINGDANLNQALIKDKRIDNLYIFPTSQTRDKDALNR